VWEFLPLSVVVLFYLLLCARVSSYPTDAAPTSLQGWEDTGLRLMERSVARSSGRTYRSGWKVWSSFAKTCGVDPLLRSPPSGWRSADHLLAFEPSVVVAFCAYACFQCGLSPATINNYLAGVSFVLKLNNINTDFLSSPAVLMAKTGLRHVYEATQDRELHTLPFTLDMVLRYISGVSLSDLSSHGMATALLLAHFNFLRVSEYVVSGANHFMRSGDVSFVTYDGRVVPARHIAAVKLSDIDRVSFFIRSSKTDQEKVGCTNHFKKCSVGTCICTTAYSWAVRANYPSDVAPFLSAYSPTGRLVWSINAKNLSLTLKTVAATYGFSNLDCFTPHSLRYGAASALAAAGIDEYTIKLLGRWRSNAFMQYIRLSSIMLDSACAALSNPQAMSAADVAFL
jgi:hypothetical protein